jgi:hypothetical protein
MVDWRDEEWERHAHYSLYASKDLKDGRSVRMQVRSDSIEFDCSMTKGDGEGGSIHASESINLTYEELADVIHSLWSVRAKRKKLPGGT